MRRKQWLNVLYARAIAAEASRDWYGWRLLYSFWNMRDLWESARIYWNNPLNE
jgi:hypothetical protein